jgi:hypothetical protein
MMLFDMSVESLGLSVAIDEVHDGGSLAGKESAMTASIDSARTRCVFGEVFVGIVIRAPPAESLSFAACLDDSKPHAHEHPR